MSYIVKTTLGRYVDANDWQETQSDTIRRVLFDAGSSPLNPSNDGVELTPLCNATGLSPADVQALCDELAHNREVEKTTTGRYRLTSHGRVTVRNILARGPFDGVM